MKPRQLFAVGLLACSALTLSAQSGEILVRAVGETHISSATAAGLVAAVAGTVLPSDAAGVDLQYLRALGYRLGGLRDSEPMTKAGFALMVAQVFDLRGGLRYELFPAPVSAFRELQHRELFFPWEYPGQSMSGRDAVNLAREVAAGALNRESHP
ncbi:MAG: hypothetical protein EA404_08785 [Spirochaetaceae bacterium]|nr:MAG: hypothetical protein EA404_08785 [Spirochaetaceae bacterium]